MELVSILESGEPAEKPCPLPQIARDICRQQAEHYKRIGFSPPWTGYLAFEEQVCVGACGFKTLPANNKVEIAYFTFPEHQGKGIATEMAQHLILIAQSALLGVTPTAQTLPEQSASTSILRKLGFTNLGEVLHPEDGKVWNWELIQNREFDLSLIERTLALSYEKRLLEHDGALTLVLELQKQGEILRSQADKNA